MSGSGDVENNATTTTTNAITTTANVIQPFEIDDPAQDVGALSESDKQSYLRNLDLRVLPVFFLFNLALSVERALIDNNTRIGMGEHLGFAHDHDHGHDVAKLYHSYYAAGALSSIVSVSLFLKTNERMIWFCPPLAAACLRFILEPLAKDLSQLLIIRVFIAICHGVLAVVMPFYLCVFYVGTKVQRTEDQRFQHMEELTARYAWYLLATPLATIIGFYIPTCDFPSTNCQSVSWQAMESGLGIAIFCVAALMGMSLPHLPYSREPTSPRSQYIRARTARYQNVNQDPWYDAAHPRFMHNNLECGKIFNWIFLGQCLVAFVLNGCFASLPLLLEHPHDAAQLWLPALIIACGSLLPRIFTRPRWLQQVQRLEQKWPVFVVIAIFCLAGLTGYTLLWITAFYAAPRHDLHVPGVLLASMGVLGASFRFTPWVLNNERFYCFKAVRLAMVVCSGQVRALLATGVLFQINDPKRPGFIDASYLAVPMGLMFVCLCLVLGLGCNFCRMEKNRRASLPAGVQDMYTFMYMK